MNLNANLENVLQRHGNVTIKRIVKMEVMNLTVQLVPARQISTRVQMVNASPTRGHATEALIVTVDMTKQTAKKFIPLTTT